MKWRINDFVTGFITVSCNFVHLRDQLRNQRYLGQDAFMPASKRNDYSQPALQPDERCNSPDRSIARPESHAPMANPIRTIHTPYSQEEGTLKAYVQLEKMSSPWRAFEEQPSGYPPSVGQAIASTSQAGCTFVARCHNKLVTPSATWMSVVVVTRSSSGQSSFPFPFSSSESDV